MTAKSPSNQTENEMTLTYRAAQALDLSTAAAAQHVGIHTDRVRANLAAYLDGVLKMKLSLVRRHCEYLEMIACAV